MSLLDGTEGQAPLGEMCMSVAPVSVANRVPVDEDGLLRTPWCHLKRGHDGPCRCGEHIWAVPELKQRSIMEEAVMYAAVAAHEANRIYCQMTGDYSQTGWQSAPDWQKESALAGVRAILDNPELTPEQSHENWMALKQREGWVYGEVKDPEKKTHPCMVPYAKLPPGQRAKDEIFVAVVRGVLAHYVGKLVKAVAK